jgi:excisionase family DNA binding protein
MATQLLTIPEVAARLGLQPATVRRMLSRGVLPRIRPTKRAVRVREQDVESLILNGYRLAGTSDPAGKGASKD